MLKFLAFLLTILFVTLSSYAQIQYRVTNQSLGRVSAIDPQSFRGANWDRSTQTWRADSVYGNWLHYSPSMQEISRHYSFLTSDLIGQGLVKTDEYRQDTAQYWYMLTNGIMMLNRESHTQYNGQRRQIRYFQINYSPTGPAQSGSQTLSEYNWDSTISKSSNFIYQNGAWVLTNTSYYRYGIGSNIPDTVLSVSGSHTSRTLHYPIRRGSGKDTLILTQTFNGRWNPLTKSCQQYVGNRISRQDYSYIDSSGFVPVSGFIIYHKTDTISSQYQLQYNSILARFDTTAWKLIIQDTTQNTYTSLSLQLNQRTHLWSPQFGSRWDTTVTAGVPSRVTTYTFITPTHGWMPSSKVEYIYDVMALQTPIQTNATLHPNPTTNQATATLPNAQPIHTATLHDATGRQVGQGQLRGTQALFNLEALPPGLYQVHLQGAISSAHGTLIKE